MGMLGDQVMSGLRLSRLIFHVVGPSNDDLVLMDEVDASGFERFFLDRVIETNVGNRFVFIGPEHGVLPSLNAMSARPDEFVELSKRMAQAFQGQHEVVASKKGAFIVSQLSGAPYPIFALIKLDDLRVLRFRQVSKGGLVKATVSEIDNTFVEDKKAVQKSALISLEAGNMQLSVFDRTNRRDIGGYFRTFLGVQRLYSSKDATGRMIKALTSAFNKFKDDAPAEIKRTWRHRLFEETRRRETVEPETTLDEFGASVFGSFWQNEAFRSEIDTQFTVQKISGESIEIDKDQIAKPRTKKLKTAEDVFISYPVELEGSDRISRVDKEDGSSVITIRTTKIVDDELVAQDLH